MFNAAVGVRGRRGQRSRGACTVMREEEREREQPLKDELELTKSGLCMLHL